MRELFNKNEEKDQGKTVSDNFFAMQLQVLSTPYMKTTLHTERQQVIEWRKGTTLIMLVI